MNGIRIIFYCMTVQARNKMWLTQSGKAGESALEVAGQDWFCFYLRLNKKAARDF